MALCQEHPKRGGMLVEHRDCIRCTVGRFNLMKDHILETDETREEHRLWLEKRLTEAWTELKELEHDIQSWEDNFTRDTIKALEFWLDGYDDWQGWVHQALGGAMKVRLQQELDQRESLKGHLGSLIQGMLTRPEMYALTGGELELSFLTAVQCWCLATGQRFTNKMGRLQKYMKNRGLIPALRVSDQFEGDLSKTAEFFNTFWRIDRWDL